MQSYANHTFPGNGLELQEILITIMEISETGGSEDRIAALEKKIRDLDALVKGLIAELLDLKSMARTMTREAEETSRQELKRGTIIQSSATPASAGPSAAVSSEGSTLIRPRGARQPDVPAAPAEPEMVRIMQTDGTMKMEPRFGGAINTSTVGYGRTKKGTFASGKQEPLIYAADEEKSGSAKKK